MCPSKPLVRETVTPRVKFPPFGWELSGGGGSRPASRSNASEFDSPPGLEARRAAFQELRPGAGPTLGTVPQTPS